jgi:fructosamine-3-kinase
VTLPRLSEAEASVLQSTFGVRVSRIERVGGGDINAAFRAHLSQRPALSYFVKINPSAREGFFEGEVHGLEWLGAAGALRVPRVLHARREPSPHLVLEWIEPGPRVADFDERLGTGLAALHRAGAPSFGLEHDNFIGRLPQDNRPLPSWAAFYRERRLMPLLALARELGASDPTLDRAAERLLARLDELVGPDEPPARLHGDLWGGNLHVDERGLPVLIDPAAYAGHRELDLAMMRLFGGFGERVFAAYAASAPLAPGHEERVALYQLYPLLAHLCMFGRGYLAQVSRCVAQYA